MRARARAAQAKLLVAWAVPDETKAARLHRERQRHVAEVLLRGTHERDDAELGGPANGALALAAAHRSVSARARSSPAR